MDVARLAKRWHVQLGKPFPSGVGSFAAPARLPDGSKAVLKIPHPDRESELEWLALKAWDGHGAVKLLAHDARQNALLIERCEPGTALSRSGGAEALEIMGDLLPRLWIPASAPPFRSLTAEAAWWSGHLRSDWERFGRPFGVRLLDAALEALRDLPPTQGEQVLVNQDLHGDNVLSAQREPWLVIDPKPLAGEREFGLAPIVRSFELGHSRRDVLYRLDRLSSELGLDRERARLWSMAQTVAWSLDSTYLPSHIETAGWLLAD